MTVKRFRTKIVEIEAMQWRYNSTLFEKMRDWTEGNFRLIDERKSEDEFIDHFTAQVYDKLHDTWISVADGQWIVRGAKGEYYPCDDETFHWKYEEVAPSWNAGITMRPLAEQATLKPGERIITKEEARKINEVEPR